MWADNLKDREVEYTQKAIDKLKNISWAKPILNCFYEAGGFRSDNMPLMFEIRFAYEIHKAGCISEYEFNAGHGNSTIDFKIHGKNVWLIELVSIRTSNAAKRAIKQSGNEYEQIFSSEFGDKQTEESEMITAIQKIGEKVYRKNRGAIKFPQIQPNVYHMILIDARGYLDYGGDRFDYRQMSWGEVGVPLEYIHYSKNKLGIKEPIKGIFEESCPLESSKYIRERIHFLGFVCENDFCENEIPQKTCYFFNPQLFSNEKAKDAFNLFPLRINTG